MKKLIPVVAAILVLLGFLVYTLSTDEAGIITDNLICPGDMPAFNTALLKEGIAPGKYIKAYVSKVIDGDTIDIKFQKKAYKVRLLYIDTPESVRKGVDIQPYGIEAAKITKKLVLHKNVRLVFEKGLRDKYNRLLAYVLLADGRNINAMLVRNGFARVEAVEPNINGKKYFIKLQQKAIHGKLGIWSLEEKKQPFIKNRKGEFIPKYWYEKDAS